MSALMVRAILAGEKRRIVEIISKSLRLLGQKADAKTRRQNKR